MSPWSVPGQRPVSPKPFQTVSRKIAFSSVCFVQGLPVLYNGRTAQLRVGHSIQKPWYAFCILSLECGMKLQVMNPVKCEIWGSDSSISEKSLVMRHDTVSLADLFPTFQRNAVFTKRREQVCMSLGDCYRRFEGIQFFETRGTNLHVVGWFSRRFEGMQHCWNFRNQCSCRCILVLDVLKECAVS